MSIWAYRHYIDEPVILIIHLTVLIYSLGGGGGYGNDRGGYGNDRGKWFMFLLLV